MSSTTMQTRVASHRWNLVVLSLLLVSVVAGTARAQAPAAATTTASANVSQLGTVKAIAAGNMTLTTDKGADVTVKVPEGARLLQIAPGSKDLSTAQKIALTDIAVGDRVLVTGKPGDAGAINAIRVILTKSTDIAQKHAAEAADWQKRGGGGIVTAVKGNVLTIASGSKKIEVQTSAATIFRRYAPGSVKFEDAKPGTLADLKAGDQLRVRGDKSADGLTITADEIVSGSFRNLSGVLTAVGPAGKSVSFKDLATKKQVTVLLTESSEVKVLPPGAAQRLKAMAAGGSSAAAGGPGGTAGGYSRGGGAPGAGGAGGQGGQGGGMMRPGGGGPPDLSTMVARLPKASADELKTGTAVMVVASTGASTADAPTAITVLSGVEALLTADGAPSMTLQPMTMGIPGGEGPE